MATLTKSRSYFLPVACLLLAGVGSVSAEDDAAQVESEVLAEDPSPHRPIPLSITVRGGVALGSYEAGYLYYLTELLKNNPDSFELQVITGASAGTINSFLTLLAVSERPSSSDDQEDKTSVDPTMSLFYRVWTGPYMKLEELLDIKDAPPGALSSRDALEEIAEVIEESWRRGLGYNTDIVFGATATRVRAAEIPARKGLILPRQEAKFAFRVRGSLRHDRAPLVTNFPFLSPRLLQPLLPFRNPAEPTKEPDRKDVVADQWNFRIIRDILFASSAFPLVFPPQKISSWARTPDDYIDPPPIFTSSDHIDGAVFDNHPLRLASQIAEAKQREDKKASLHCDKEVLRRCGNEEEAGFDSCREKVTADCVVSARKACEAKFTKPCEQLTADYRKQCIKRAGQTCHDRGAPRKFHYLYIDPTHTSYPPLPKEQEPENTKELDTFFDYLTSVLGGAVSSARAKEMYTLAEERPEVLAQMVLTTRDLPTASGQLGNFFGFFDRKFLSYDFYLGMHDARNFVRYHLPQYLAQHSNMSEIELKTPEPENWVANRPWQPYFCMRAIFDQEARFAKSCKERLGKRHHDEIKDFRILMQTSLDQLYEHCRHIKIDPTIQNPHCKRAMQGHDPPKVPLVKQGSPQSWQRQEGERHFYYLMRLLNEHEFHFKDLGLDRNEGEMATMRIRQELLRYLEGFANKLDLGARFFVKSVGKPAVNFFIYAPPETILYIVAGKSGELGWSISWNRPSWWRLNLALQVKGLSTIMRSPPAVAVTPLFGTEFGLLFASNPVWQTRFGIRLGYQFSSYGRFTTSQCDQIEFHQYPGRCSAFVGQAFLAGSVFERLRIQVGAEIFPPWIPHLAPQSNYPWSWMFEMGWQWLGPFCKRRSCE